MDYNAGDSPNGYTPTHPYEDKRMLEPQRIIIPPPILDYENGRPSFLVDDVAPFNHGNASCGDPGFLLAIQSCYRLQLNHSMLAWKYENRRKAQPILPFLLLGPSSAAKDPDFLQDAGITFLLAVRSASAVRNRPNYLNPASFPSTAGIESDTFDLDNPYDLIRHLRPKLKAMNDHLQASCDRLPIKSIRDIRGKILVFCESGNERSTVIVAAYIMVIYGVDAITAIQIVQSQRFCVNVDDGMKRMLQDLEAILNAERQVASAHAVLNFPQDSTAAASLNRPSKRSIDRAYESDDEMGDDSEWNGDGGTRLGTAPFVDSEP